MRGSFAAQIKPTFFSRNLTYLLKDLFRFFLLSFYLSKTPSHSLNHSQDLR